MKARTLIFALLFSSPMACDRVQDAAEIDSQVDFISVSSLSENGYAISRKRMEALRGRMIKVRGFVDYGTVFMDSRDGRGVYAGEWRFNLKGNAGAETGRSFAVRVMKDDGRERVLEVIKQNERAGKPTEVFVIGQIFTFDAPANWSRHTGIYMTVQSSSDISFEPPSSSRQR